MLDRITRRLTYANVMATAALFVALGGSAFAAAKITGKDIKDGTITGADIKDGSLLRADFRSGQLPRGQQGAAGVAGAAGAPGAPGAPGAQGAQGIPGGALALAHITLTGAVDAAHSTNIAGGNVAHPNNGRYCISGLAFTPQSAAVTVGAGGTGFVARTSVGALALGCPAGTQVEIVTADINNVLADSDLWVVLN